MTGPEFVAACRPVVWDELYQALIEEAGLAGETPVYPGSVVAVCGGCGVEIWVGPRAQALTVPHRLRCFLCAVAEQAGEPGPAPVLNLGNPYRPGPARGGQQP